LRIILYYGDQIETADTLDVTWRQQNTLIQKLQQQADEKSPQKSSLVSEEKKIDGRTCRWEENIEKIWCQSVE